MPRNKLNPGVEKLYTENYKTFQKEIKEHQNKGKDIHVWGWDIDEMSALPSVPQIQAKLPTAFIEEREKLTLKCMCICEGPEWPKQPLKE